jgi:hypothetical protein
VGALPPRGRPIYSPQGESPPPRGEIVRLPQGESRRTAHTKRRCRDQKTIILPTGKSSHSECYHHTPHHGKASYSPTGSRSGTLTYKGFVIRKTIILPTGGVPPPRGRSSYSSPGKSFPTGGDHHIHFPPGDGVSPHRGRLSHSPQGGSLSPPGESSPTGGDHRLPHGEFFPHGGDQSTPPKGVKTRIIKNNKQARTNKQNQNKEEPKVRGDDLQAQRSRESKPGESFLPFAGSSDLSPALPRPITGSSPVHHRPTPGNQ